jgi:hypothetical protein
LAVVGLVLSVGVIMTEFIITVVSSDTSFGWKVALVYAIVATTVTIILFLLSLVRVLDVIIGIVFFVIFIVKETTEFDIYEEAIQFLADLIYKVDLLTIPKSFDFRGGEVSIDRNN